MFTEELDKLSKAFYEARRPLVIGIMGKAGSGKDSASLILQQMLGGSRFAFATRMKAALSALGIEEPTRDLKESPMDWLEFGFSYRTASQTLGTGWGRALEKGFWVNLLDKDRKAQLTNLAEAGWDNNLGVVHMLTDVRHPDEVDYVHAEGGVILEMCGRSYGMTAQASNHASETQAIQGDFRVWNIGSMQQLESQLFAVMLQVESYYLMKGVDDSLIDLERARLVHGYLDHYVKGKL